MKKISKETNIGFAIIFIASVIAVYFNTSYWHLLYAILIVYASLAIVVNRLDKKHKRERKKRVKLIFDESDHYNDNLNTSIDWTKAIDHCFDASNIKNRNLMDEFGLWEYPKISEQDLVDLKKMRDEQEKLNALNHKAK